jgi:predicted  nucleic acid-binding Zn-ribbon protein
MWQAPSRRYDCSWRAPEYSGRSRAIPPSSLTPSPASPNYSAGTFPGPGTYFCLECGSHLALHEDDRLPDCPRCGASSFRLDSIFEPMQEHGETTAEFETAAASQAPDWLDEARRRLPAETRQLAYRDEEDDEIRVFAVERGWTRIGRSVAADIRLDDPSVSRRHALIVSEPDESLRVLDDRSLNGVFVNGEEVEWDRLVDGDELTIGSYRLFVLEA